MEDSTQALVAANPDQINVGQLALPSVSEAVQLQPVRDSFPTHITEAVTIRLGLESKEHFLKTFTRALVITGDTKCKAPIITLQGEPTNVYQVLERHFRPEVLHGPEKFWKLVRTDLGLETWRPRVNGIQLKAISQARLPDSDEEFVTVAAAAQSVSNFLRPGTSVEQFVHDLRKFIEGLEIWWDHRNRRPDGPPAKRSGPALSNPMSKRIPTGPMDFLSDGSRGLMAPGDGLLKGDADFGGQVARTPRSAHLVLLNVGGCRFSTAVSTLLSVQGSYFWNMLHTGDCATAFKTGENEFFIDRNGKIFHYVLEYLRACAHGEISCPLPEESRELQSLAREAEHYMLPGLLERIHSTVVTPVPSQRALYDSLYLETGFNSIEGPSLKEMEQRKVVVMQQMNHVLQQKQADGFVVEDCKCGVNHREGHDGMTHNLFYHILLKKVVPVLPGRHGVPS